MQSIEEYLRETYAAYIEGYDRETNDLPPGDFDWWVEAHGEDSIRDAIGIGHFTPEEGVELLSQLKERATA